METNSLLICPSVKPLICNLLKSGRHVTRPNKGLFLSRSRGREDERPWERGWVCLRSRRKEIFSNCGLFVAFFAMPHWCIAYGCTNSSDMEVKKSWHRLPLENKELLSKWLAKIRQTNTPVNEHSRICGDHFEAECFTKKPGSSRVNLKQGSVPTKFCFVQEKEPRKPPKTVSRWRNNKRFQMYLPKRQMLDSQRMVWKIMTSSWISGSLTRNF